MLQSRTLFSLKAQTTKTVQTHQMSNHSFEKEQWACARGKIDSLSHILRCPKYEHLRSSCDLSNEEELVKYFQEVIKTREDDENLESHDKAHAADDC